MRDELDRDVQQWFERSVDKVPRETFTLAVLKRIRRRERTLHLQRYAGLCVAFASFCLLLAELLAPLSALIDALAALPLTVLAAGGAQWPLLVLLVAGFGYGLLRHVRGAGFLRRW